MAKRKTTPTQRKWQPSPEDAINLAAIRWFAISIEAKAIEIYGTNPQVYPEILTALRKGLSAINTVSVKGLSAINTVSVKKPIAAEGDCPPGWVPCGDDCAPACSDA